VPSYVEIADDPMASALDDGFRLANLRRKYYSHPPWIQTMTGFKEPDMGAGAQTFLQKSIGYFRDGFMSELTRISSPHLRLLEANRTVY
jgi:hypothetical protein